MLALAGLPHTWAEGSEPEVQDVPAGAFVKHGVSGDGPQHAGLIEHWLLETGRSVASSTEVTPPAPLQATFWQSPGVWTAAGATVLPGYTHAPTLSQSVALQAAIVAEHVAVQQWVPAPLGPHSALEHWLLPLHTAPAAPLGMQVPPEQKLLADWQSVSLAHAARHAVALAHLRPPGQAAATPGAHTPVPSQEAAVVSWPLLHDAVPHEVPLPGYTQAPETVQPVAPQAPPAVQAAAQQLPEPFTPQAPLLHCASPVQVAPLGLSWQVPP